MNETPFKRFWHLSLKLLFDTKCHSSRDEKTIRLPNKVGDPPKAEKGFQCVMYSLPYYPKIHRKTELAWGACYYGPLAGALRGRTLRFFLHPFCCKIFKKEWGAFWPFGDIKKIEKNSQFRKQNKRGTF